MWFRRVRQRRLVTTGTFALLCGICTFGAATASSAASNAPIKIMIIGAAHGPVHQNGNYFQGASAAVKSINASGGVNGHQLDLIICDYNDDVSLSDGCARQAASDGVAATVSVTTSFGTTTFPIFQSENIPLIGVLVQGSYQDFHNPMSFPLIGGSIAEYLAAPFALKGHGVTKAAAVPIDLAAAQSLATLGQRTARSAGLSWAGSVQVPLTASDLTPYAAKLQSLGANGVIWNLSTNLTVQMLRAMSSLGLNIKWIGPESLINESNVSLVGDQAKNGLVLGYLPPFRATTQYPGLRRWLSEVRADPGGQSDAFLTTSGSLNGWLSVYAFKQVAETIKGAIDNNSVVKALNTKRSRPFNLFGLVQWKPWQSGPKAFPRMPLNSVIYVEKFDSSGHLVLADKKPIEIFKLLNAYH